MSDVAAPQAPVSTPTPSAEPSSASNVNAASSPKSSPPASPSQPQEQWDVKVNGKMVKMTRQEALDHASMAYAANEKFNEAKKTRQEVDRILSKAKQSPIEALLDPTLGLSKDQVRDALEKWYAKEFIEPESLTAEQRKLKEYEEKLSKYEQSEKEKKAQEEKTAEEKMTEQERGYVQSQIIEAIDKSGLPKNPETVKKIAFYMRQNLINGWDAPMDFIIRQVKKEQQTSYRGGLENSSAEQIIELFGDEIVNKIRQYDLNKLRASRQAPPVAGNSYSSGVGVQDTKERLNSSDVRKRLNDIRRNGF